MMYRLLVLALVAMIAAVQYRLWVSEEGIPAIKRLEARVEQQSEENARLRSRNERLEAEVRDLKSGLEAVEERARRELGMIAEGETFFQFVAPLGARDFASPLGARDFASPLGARDFASPPETGSIQEPASGERPAAAN